MFRLGADLKVYLHREPIDFRAGINSLAVLVPRSFGVQGDQAITIASDGLSVYAGVRLQRTFEQ
jgi:transposase